MGASRSTGSGGTLPVDSPAAIVMMIRDANCLCHSRAAMRRRCPPAAMRGPYSRRRFLKGGLAVAAALPAFGRLARGQSQQVNVYNWDTYIGETTLEDFTDATGIAVRYDLYADNDELFAKLREGNPGYDVIVPTNDYVERMVVADLLLPLDHARIPNLANVDPAFADPAFDPGLQHSMPYFWGTVGLGYRKSAANPTALADLFAKDDYAGRISLLNSIDSIRAALKYLGHSLNTREPAQLDEAVELLIANKPKIKAFAPDTGQDLLIAGEVDICLDYNGDVLQVMEEDDDLDYVVPAEGSLLWEDNCASPRAGPTRRMPTASSTSSSTPRSTARSPPMCAIRARMRPRSSSSRRRTATIRRSTRRARCSSAVRCRSTRARRSRACTRKR